MKKICFVLIALFTLSLVGCNSANEPVVTSNPNNPTSTSGIVLDYSSLEQGAIDYVYACYEDGVDSLNELKSEYIEARSPEDQDSVYIALIDAAIRYITDPYEECWIVEYEASHQISARSASGSSLSAPRYYNGSRVTSISWKQFVAQFRRYSGVKYHSEYGDLMEFIVKGSSLYFIYSFDTGDATYDGAWDLTTYDETLAAMMSSVTYSVGQMPEYGVGITPPTCGEIIGIDTTAGAGDNGVMFLLEAAHHTNWGTGYCYDTTGYHQYGDGVHENCYIPMHVVFYPDGIHIRQACYAGYTVKLPECSFCTACFRQKTTALVNLPYDKGDWTYEAEYGPRAAVLHQHHLVSGYFKEY